MENAYSYNSYPESGGSSPRSREIDFENPPPPWDENYKVKFMCSYGGKIQPRPHDNHLSYVDGDTKILAVDRSIKFNSLVAKLSSLCDAEFITFKYQLPGEDLDALISVANDDDLEHMMNEYDRLYRATAKSARMRLFLFPGNLNRAFGSQGSSSSERERTFVEAINYGPSEPVQNAADFLQPHPVQNAADFLHPHTTPLAEKLRDPVSEPAVPSPDYTLRTGYGLRVVGPDQVMMPIQRQLQELQRLRINEHEQSMYRRKSDEIQAGCHAGDYYVHKLPEKVSPSAHVPVSVPSTVTAPVGYWPEQKIVSSVAGFPAPVTATPGLPEQPLYMIPPPIVRPATGPTGQGYYTVQRMNSDVYREQPVPVVHTSTPPQQQPPLSAAPPPQTMPFQPPRVAAYPDASAVVRQSGGGIGTVAMAYDSNPGRQVYYTAPGGAVVVPPQYHGVAAPVVGGGAVGPQQHDSKLVAKLSPGSM